MAEMLYLECGSGIAGDMLVAALLDLGADEQAMRRALASLPVDGFDVRVSRVSKSGVDACDFDVVLEEGLENHDHDMAWLHGHEHGHAHDHAEGHHREHDHADGHHHEHSHDHAHDHEHGHGHHHEHRGLADVLAVIDAADLTEGARSIARRAFEILAKAEAKAHGTTSEEVKFHEVGAIDSIVDVISASALLDSLGITRVCVPALTEGSGTIRAAHGIMQIPVPATLNICEAAGIPLEISGVRGELVTPTGAALAAAIRTDDALPARFSVVRSGLGAGKRDYACPGVLRAMLVEPVEASADPQGEELVWKLECDLDDSSGETLGHVMGRLLDAGAREVHYLPIFTKKGRPAWQLQVLCTEEKIERFEGIIFSDTTTIGIRRQALQRTILPREQVSVVCELGEVEVKRVTLPDGERRSYPEYESVAALAETAGVSFQRAWQAAMAACAGEG